MFQLLFGSFLLRELPVPFTGHHDITSVWAGSQPPAFAAQPHALVVPWHSRIYPPYTRLSTSNN